MERSLKEGNLAVLAHAKAWLHSLVIPKNSQALALVACCNKVLHENIMRFLQVDGGGDVSTLNLYLGLTSVPWLQGGATPIEEGTLLRNGNGGRLTFSNSARDC